MYKLCFLFCFATLFASCGKKYKIEGMSSVSLLDGKMLFIKVVDGDHLVNIDSAEVVHGLFKMEGRVDSTMLASLYMDENCIMPLVIEKGKITIKIDNARISVKGTPLNDSFYDFITKKTSLDDRAYEVERLESRMIMDGADSETVHREIEAKRKVVSDEMNKLAKNFIQDNYDNVLGTGVFIMLCNGMMPYPVLTPMMEEIVQEAPDRFLNNPIIKEILVVAENNRQRMQATIK